MLSDRLLDDAFWFAIAMIVSSVCLILIVLWLQGRNAGRRRRIESDLRDWNALFARKLKGEVCEFPVIEKATAVDVLRMWHEFAEQSLEASNRNELSQRLDAMARSIMLDKIALEFIDHGDTPEKIVGARVLGYLGAPSVGFRLATLCSDKDGDVSFAAAAALLRIDRSFARSFLSYLRYRSDWIATHVERAVRENALILGPEFVRVIRDADDTGIGRLIAFASLLDREFVRAVTRCVLERPQSDAENISAALRTLGPFVESADLPFLHRLSADPVAGIRVQAVNALSRLHDPRVATLLAACLNDPDPWVRRRADEALAHRSRALGRQFDGENFPESDVVTPGNRSKILSSQYVASSRN
jgi:HEAT repeats